MKKIFFALMVFSLLLAAVSCGETPGTSDGSQTDDILASDTGSDTSRTDPADTDSVIEPGESTEKVEVVDPVKPSKLTIGQKDYEQLLVYNEFPENGYTARFVQSARIFMNLDASVIDEDMANLVITNDVAAFSSDAEWAVAVKDGKIYIAGASRYAIDVAYVKFQDIISDMKGKYTFSEKVLAQGKLPAKDDYLETEQLVIYPEFDSRVNRIYDYKVTVSQRNLTAEIPVYNHSMEYALTSRSVGGDIFRRFAHFAFSGDMVRVDIRVGSDFNFYSILPTAKDFDTEYNNGVITVYLEEPEYFAVRLDGNDATILSVFSDYPEYPLDIPEKNDKNVHYIEDWYETENGIWEITKSDTTVYIAPGAVVNARIKFNGKNFKNSRVIGRGAIIDPFGNLNKTDIRQGGTEGAGTKMVSFAGDNWVYDGPVCIDARCFNIIMSGNNGVVRNYKAVASMMNTDGITIGGKNHLVERCFMYVGDNGLVISGASDTVFRNITIGTTCAALFPQMDNVGILLEDIYVFRTNDGVLNNTYNGDGTKARRADITVKNLYCEDCLNLPQFFRGENIGTLDKVYNFINVSLPSICGTSDAHDSWKPNTNRLVQMKNTDTKLFTEIYTLNFTNLYINGTAIKARADVYMEDKWKNTYTFANDGKFKAGLCKSYEADHHAQDKVYIGGYQVHFDADIVRVADTLYLPADEILRALFSTAKPTTVKIGNVSYVTLEALKAANVIEDFNEAQTGIYLVPIQNGQNLLFPEEGEVSRYSEISCYQVELVVEKEDDNPVYYMHNYRNRNTGGISRFIHNEIKTYGQGTYEFSFKMKGSGEGIVNMLIMHDTIMQSTRTNKELNVDDEWMTYTVKLDITADIVMCESYFIAIQGTNKAPLDYFAIKDFSLVKKS